MTLLTRDQSLNTPPLLKTEKVPVPEFGEDAEIALRALTGTQRWEFGQMMSKAGDDDYKGPEPTSYLITLAAIDGDGKKLYQVQDCDIIAEWPGDLIDRIGTVVMKMSGLSADDSGKASKSASRPSSETLSDSGPTASPETSPAPSAS